MYFDKRSPLHPNQKKVRKNKETYDQEVPASSYLGLASGFLFYLRYPRKCSESVINLSQLDEVETHLEDLRDLVLQKCRFVMSQHVELPLFYFLLKNIFALSDNILTAFLLFHALFGFNDYEKFHLFLYCNWMHSIVLFRLLVIS